jgi:hypothetical protein
MLSNDFFQTPILFLVFKRPSTTRKVFNVIKKIEPKYLYVAADGPREHKEGEKEKCEEVRAIVKEIDWDCELKTLFRDKNLGTKIAVSSAIDWFFENVSEGIILEDDCVPSLTFFPYCEGLLTKYRDDDRVMTISGDASVFKNRFDNSKYSYFFSHYTLTWGWATWKRAWSTYDVDLKDWNEVKKDKNSFPVLKNRYQRKYWFMMFDRMYINGMDAWDYQWTYNSLINNGLTIIPKSNLILNIGYGPDATNYYGKKDYRIEFPIKEIDFPLVHNTINDKNIDKIDMIIEKNTFYVYRSFIRSFFRELKGFISSKLKFLKK